MSAPGGDQRYFDRIPGPGLAGLLSRERLNLHAISMRSASVLHKTGLRYELI